MNTLTEAEAAALQRLLARRNSKPNAIVRWQERIYVRIFSYHYVLKGDDFEPLHGMFPNTVFMRDVVTVAWSPEG